MSASSEKKASGLPVLSAMREKLKLMNGIDLSKFKTLSVSAKDKVVQSAKSLYTDFSNYKIITIAGEAVALGETGLLSDEKVLHDMKNFETLYVPDALKPNQDNLQELLIRMFAMSGSSARKEIIPPKDDAQYDMLIQSLKHRLTLLQGEVVEADPATLDAREKLAHFYRLKALIESLMKQHEAKKGSDYEPVSSDSGKPPAKGEEKLPLTDAEAMRLLQQFGFVLLQAQHQLPGYKFPFSTRGVVQQVQSLDIDEKTFQQEIEDGGLVIHPSIQDVLDPGEREKAIVARILQSVQGVLEDFIEASGNDRITDYLATLVDPDSPPKDIQTLVESLTQIISSLDADLEKFAIQNGALLKAIESAEAKVARFKAEKSELETKVRDCEEREVGLKYKDSEEVKALKADLQLVKRSEELVNQRLELAETELRALKVKGVETSELQTKFDASVAKVKRLQALLKEKDLELGSLTDTVKRLEAKEAEWDATHEKLSRLEELETLTRQQENEMKTLRGKLAEISKGKTELEEQLSALEKKLEEEVPEVANTNFTDKSEFEKFSARVLSLLPSHDDNTLTTVSSTTGKRSNNNNTVSTISSLTDNEDPLNVVETPFDETYLIPSLLELKGKFVQNFCRFIPALDALFDDFLRTPEGEIIEQRLNKFIDQKLLAGFQFYTLTPQVYPSTPETNSKPARLAEMFQSLLLYANEPKAYEKTLEPHDSLLKQMANLLNPVADELDANFKQAFTKKGIKWESMEQYNRALQDFKIKSYPLVFYLYLLTLRDWVTCLNENLPTPVECPKIPPSLLRKEMTNKC